MKFMIVILPVVVAIGFMLLANWYLFADYPNKTSKILNHEENDIKSNVIPFRRKEQQ
jgi:hypothetical protein